MPIRITDSRLQFSCCLVLGLMFCLIVGCTTSSEPADGVTHDILVPLEDALTDVVLQANQTTEVVVTLHVPPTVGVVESAVLDVSATLEHLSISNVFQPSNVPGLAKALSGQELGEALIRVGDDAATACQQGDLYGPYSIAGSLIEPLIDVETIELNQSTIQTVNAGFAILCMQIFSTFNATLNVTQLEGTVTEGECGTPADFSGVWNGTFNCTDSCDEPWGGDIELTVTQDGSTASYEDWSGDQYTGTVCGNLFRFERIESHETERGTMTLEGANQATKRSTWRGRSAPFCGGNCVDHLTRGAGQ